MPRYGLHEAKIINKLVTTLESNGLIDDDDDGLWGAMVVLAAKPGQDDIPVDQFKWRRCISYRKVNQVTKPFTFPIP